MSGQQPPAHLLAAHLINQTNASISLLEQLSLLSAPDAHLIRSKLPSSAGPFPNLGPLDHSQTNLAHSISALSVASDPHGPPSYGQQQQQGIQQPDNNPPVSSPHPSLPPRRDPPVRLESRARALWDYRGTEADDLAMQAGDTVIIDEEVNEQWFRGRVIPQGETYPRDRSGLFPSNFIQKIDPQSQSPSYFPPPIAPVSNQMVQYAPPGPPVPYGYDPKPQYSGQMVASQAPSQVMSPPAVVQQQKPNRFGKVGSQLGHAAVNGFGFGAGATIAGDLVNKIF